MRLIAALVVILCINGGLSLLGHALKLSTSGLIGLILFGTGVAGALAGLMVKQP